MDSVSGVGVLDKAFVVLNALVMRPLTLAEVIDATQIPRATSHRLLSALEHHGAVRRNNDGLYCLGPTLLGLGRGAAVQFPFLERAREVATELRDRTGESVQVFVPETDGRRCVVSLESPNGLRWIVPEGALFPLSRGSAGRVLTGSRLSNAGWVESVEERVKGVASVSAPIVDVDGAIIAALSVSGPLERMSAGPGAKFGALTVRGAKTLSDFLAS
ncbi:MAG: helix-turn-helix domain-containing protein [Actinomycetota bacterium]